MKERPLLILLFTWAIFLNSECNAQRIGSANSVINESTPSKSIYFDWINRNWYGSNEKKIEANLRFFKWLHEEYGMKLDIYLMDAGDIDQGPNCAPIGLPPYGSLETDWFKRRFPNGFEPLNTLAKSFDCSLGIWLGPDGYGSSKIEAQERMDMLVKFCKEYQFALFKFDACCSDLSSQNQKYFIETMQKCREYSPELIVLNHRISLNEEARKLTSTFLWEGRETYVDVNISNKFVAPHHRAENLSRGLPPGLMRLTEDHGVCISSANDNWDDDLILQAFNRNLILSPEIYGNPFLLSDEMLPRLARIYNIHRLYNEILVNGIVLPEETYGQYAVSRGDSSTRLLTFRNLSWQPLQIKIKLDESIGLMTNGSFSVLQYHPTEFFLGDYKKGEEVTITVMPFRASLVKVSSEPQMELVIKGIDYQIIKNVEGKPLKINLLGSPGEEVEFSLFGNLEKFRSARINGKAKPSLLKGKNAVFSFPGERKRLNSLTKIGELESANVPDNSDQLMESCLFSNNNNALEVRELVKAGTTGFQEVQAARNAFFKDTLFTGLGIWDRNAFDSDLTTFFKVRRFEYRNLKENHGAFRLDLGRIQDMDRLVFRGIPDKFNPELIQVSGNLSDWESLDCRIQGTELILDIPKTMKIRYLRMAKSPAKVAEIEGYKNGNSLARENWSASNLFNLPKEVGAKLCWKKETNISGIGKEAKLCVTAPAKCKEGTVFAFAIVEGEIIAAIDRAPSFPYNNWEHYSTFEGEFTFYIPISQRFEGKMVQVMILTTDRNLHDLKPEVWLNNPNLYERAELIIE